MHGKGTCHHVRTFVGFDVSRLLGASPGSSDLRLRGLCVIGGEGAMLTLAALAPSPESRSELAARLSMVEFRPR